MSEHTVTMPRRVVSQPEPFCAPQGDCGACVLSGLLDIPILDIYERYRDGERLGLTWPAMRSVLHRAMADSLLDRIVTDVPSWMVHDSQQAWGSPGWCQNLQWFNYVRMAVDAGYYGIAQVNLSRKPLAVHDHWIMICGIRQSVNGSSIDQEILVSCSARSTPDEEWVNSMEFLTERGGFNVLLARPAK